MHKIEIWAQLVERYPTWSDREIVVKLKAGGLKALIDQAYDNGFEAGVTTKVPPQFHGYESTMSKFEQIFGFKPGK
jgi:hypothetical protein